MKEKLYYSSPRTYNNIVLHLDSDLESNYQMNGVFLAVLQYSKGV
jgi:hypothetical protein